MSGKGMDRAAHFRCQANHARQLADATHKGDLEDLLVVWQRDYDEVAHDIETGANEIRHAELLDDGSPSYWRLGPRDDGLKSPRCRTPGALAPEPLLCLAHTHKDDRDRHDQRPSAKLDELIQRFARASPVGNF
jgi:hypothetical protein